MHCFTQKRTLYVRGSSQILHHQHRSSPYKNDTRGSISGGTAVKFDRCIVSALHVFTPPGTGGTVSAFAERDVRRMPSVPLDIEQKFQKNKDTGKLFVSIYGIDPKQYANPRLSLSGSKAPVVSKWYKKDIGVGFLEDLKTSGDDRKIKDYTPLKIGKAEDIGLTSVGNTTEISPGGRKQVTLLGHGSSKSKKLGNRYVDIRGGIRLKGSDMAVAYYENPPKDGSLIKATRFLPNVAEGKHIGCTGDSGTALRTFKGGTGTVFGVLSFATQAHMPSWFGLGKSRSGIPAHCNTYEQNYYASFNSNTVAGEEGSYERLEKTIAEVCQQPNKVKTRGEGSVDGDMSSTEPTYKKMSSIMT